MRGNRGHGLVAVGDGGKQIQVDRATQRDAALESLQSIERDLPGDGACGCGEDDIRPSSPPHRNRVPRCALRVKLRTKSPMVQAMGKLAISFAVLALQAWAASDDAAIQNTFVKPWVEALRSKDKARIERFYHPAVRACVNPATQEYFDYMLDQEAHSDTRGMEHVTKLAPLKSVPTSLIPEDGFSIPVQPTYEIQVDFDQGQLMVEYLAESNGSWFEVLLCPNEKGMAYFRKQLVEGAEQRKKVAQLLADVKDPLRSELRDFLRRGQKNKDTMKRYPASGRGGFDHGSRRHQRAAAVRPLEGRNPEAVSLPASKIFSYCVSSNSPLVESSTVCKGLLPARTRTM